jgi:diaminobutyrate-2-oxoglutarate transaminase
MPSAAAAASGVRGGPASWESSARTYSRNLPLALVGLPLHGLDFPTPVRGDFVEALLASLPAGLGDDPRVHFCGPTGADAVEAALKLIRIVTGRRATLAFRGGYHGMTAGALAATGNVAVKARAGGLATDVHFLPYPYAYRCPFRLGGELGWQVGASYVERLLDDPESGMPPVAGMLLEVVQGEGGSIPAPVGWLRAMRRITADRGIPLIVDEVQTGLGRAGRLFAVEHAGVVPDVLVLSKAIGGGLPLAVLVYAAALDRWPPGAHTGTFRGNQLAMAAGAAAGGLARRVQAASLRRRLIVELGGRHGAVARFLPPLILTATQVDQIAERFADAVAMAESEHAAGGPS